MQRTMSGLAAAGVAAIVLAGCTGAPSKPPTTLADGTVRLDEARVEATYACSEMPVLLQGDRTVITLTGGCNRVTVAGRRNDVFVEVAPGGTIEITGDRNDVSWRKVGAGPDPLLQDLGRSNAFHSGFPPTTTAIPLGQPAAAPSPLVY